MTAANTKPEEDKPISEAVEHGTTVFDKMREAIKNEFPETKPIEAQTQAKSESALPRATHIRLADGVSSGNMAGLRGFSFEGGTLYPKEKFQSGFAARLIETGVCVYCNAMGEITN